MLREGRGSRGGSDGVTGLLGTQAMTRLLLWVLRIGLVDNAGMGAQRLPLYMVYAGIWVTGHQRASELVEPASAEGPYVDGRAVVANNPGYRITQRRIKGLAQRTIQIPRTGLAV